jgi:hypothetical protein
MVAFSAKRHGIRFCGILGNAMTTDDEIKKLSLVVDTAREVWGTA